MNKNDMKKIAVLLVLFLTSICTLVNAQDVWKISSNIKMSIMDDNVVITIVDNDNFDGYNHLYPINFGRIDQTLSTLSQMEDDLENGESFSSVSYDLLDSQLNGLNSIDEYGNKYILINTNYQYEIYLSHIKKMKKRINKYIKNGN